MSILLDKAIATQIRENRVAMGLSQAELARVLEVSQAAIGQWERGVAKPRGKHILAMSKYFGRPIGVTVAAQKTEVATDLSPSDQESIYGALRRVGKHGHELESLEFEDELYDLLKDKIPGVRRGAKVRAPNGVTWMLDIHSDQLGIDVKHPATLQAAAAGVAIRAALFDAAARRANFGSERMEIVIVRLPAALDGTPAQATDIIKYSLRALGLNAASLGVHMIVADTAMEAGMHMIRLIEANEDE